MEIKLENYNNIRKIDLNIEDNKINFLYGISGSGKSSIGSAINEKEINEDNVKIGKNKNDVSVIINPQVSSSIYNKNYVNSILVEENSENIYNIIFSDGENLQEKKKEIQNVFSKLYNNIEPLMDYKNKINNIVSSYKIKKDKENEKMFPKTSLIGKLEKDIDNPIHKKYSEKIKQEGIEYFEWKKKGLEFHHFNDGNCPFCLRKLSEYRKQLLGELIEIVPKNFEILVRDTNILSEVGIENIDFKKRNIQKIKKELIEKIKLCSEIELILEKIESFYYNNNHNKFIKIKLSKQFICQFPDVAAIIESLNENIIEINKSVSQLAKTTNKIIDKNEKKINDYLFALGIPYVFQKEKYNTSEKKASYLLYHRDDTMKNKRTKSLSEGEKNLLSLIFFVVSSKNDFMVIDDPASSYDETRKGIIFNIICENLKNKTVLVLSHDQMFSKYATFEKYNSKGKFKNNIGVINIIENYTGDAVINNIYKEDFNRLEQHIINHFDNNMPYYRKIINLKLLSEIHKNNRKKKNKIVYGYISDILHGEKTKNEILEKLLEEGYDEQKVLRTIKKIFHKSISLEPMPNNFFENFVVEDLTCYERIVLERERMNPQSKKNIIRCEYNNIVHLNNNYLSVLNPYKFNYFSPAIYELIFKN